MAFIVSKLTNDQVFTTYNKPEKGKNFEATKKILVRGMQSVFRKESMQSQVVAVTEVSEGELKILEEMSVFKDFVDGGFIITIKSDSKKDLESAIEKLSGTDKSCMLTKKQLLKDVKTNKADIDVEFNKEG